MKNKPAVVTCDACDRRFQVHNQAERVKGGEMQFFVCPHCGRRYEYAFVTHEGIALRSLLGSLRSLKDRGLGGELTLKMYQETLDEYRKEVRPGRDSRAALPDTSASTP